jgi:nicotinamide mononucleotide transporter
MEQLIDYILDPYTGYSALDIALEATAVFFGLLSVWFARKANIWVYPTGIISTSIYIYITLYIGLYADTFINTYYTAMSVYGWYVWTRVGSNDKPTPVSRLKKNERIYAAVFLIGAIGLLFYILKTYTDSTVPFIDATTTGIAFVAMWLMAKKKVENWSFWIAADLISVPLYLYKGLAISAFQFTVFLVLAIMGLIEWRKILKEERA